MDNPYEWLQRFIEQVPDLLQPLIIAAAAAIPYVEGEGAAALGIIAGINPVVAAIAAALGNFLCVLGVVVLGSGIRERVVARRAGRTGSGLAEGAAVAAPLRRSSDGGMSDPGALEPAAVSLLEHPEDATNAKQTRREKGRARLRRWMVRFGVPGTSILAPLALPTMLTAAFFVGAGVPKRWVILWQGVAITLWTGAVAIAATGVVAFLGW